MKKQTLILAALIMVIIICGGCGRQQSESGKNSEDVAIIETQMEENTVFAEQIQAAMADKDLEALAALCFYPVAVNSEVIDNKEAFMELGEDVIFTEERCAVIAAVDIFALEETKAGFIMGEDKPNIIFQLVDEQWGITGIN